MLVKLINNSGLVKDTMLYDVETADNLILKWPLARITADVNPNEHRDQVKIFAELNFQQIDVHGQLVVVARDPKGENSAVKLVRFWNGLEYSFPR